MNSDPARVGEEQATERRARILGLNYVNTLQLAEKPLYKDVLSVPELYSLKVIPLQVNRGSLVFGITTTTSQQTMTDLRQRFTDSKVDFAIISDGGYREYMRL